MTPVFVYIQFRIKNSEAFKRYAEQVSATTHQYGGKTIAVNELPVALYGEADVDVCVIQQWPSLEVGCGFTQPQHGSLQC